jgi:spore coat polysaccharide biosynthesis protein SpsF
MKFSIIVEARLGSSRLPNKILYKINKYTFLEYLIKRLKLVKNAKEIIIATTDNEENDEIIRIAKKNKIKYLKGSEKNVIQRVIKTGKKFSCEKIVRITSDCPIIDPQIIDLAIESYNNNKCDYLSNTIIRSYPDGMDVEVFSLKTLIRSYKFANTVRSKEWTTWSIRQNPKKFKIINIIAPKDLKWPDLGLTLDEYRDYFFLKKIILHYKETFDFKCLDIIELLKKNKKWLNINKSVKRNV